VASKHLKGSYAGFVSRLLAFIIDVVIISFTIGAVTWFLSVTATVLQLRSILGFSLSAIPGSAEFIDALFGPVVATAFIAVVIIAYHIFFIVFAGQTPGKALLGLRVVSLDGKRLGYGKAILRLLGYFISGIPLYLGFFWVIFDDRRQAWHDKIAGTCVIYTWEARPDEQFLSREIQQLENPSPTGPPPSGAQDQP
jgi:uncharacterized RDD family membrane protein YckC